MTATPTNTKTMKAAYFERRTGVNNPVPSYGDVPRPVPGAGEVLVWVQATSIMPTELTWRTTWETQSGVQRAFPVILGHEFSGLVAGLGQGSKVLTSVRRFTA